MLYIQIPWSNSTWPQHVSRSNQGFSSSYTSSRVYNYSLSHALDLF